MTIDQDEAFECALSAFDEWQRRTRLEAKVRRMLRKRAMTLHKSKAGRFTVIDRLTWIAPKDAPSNAPIEAVFDWIASLTAPRVMGSRQHADKS